MIKKSFGFIGCGNMGGAILYGALQSGVLDAKNVYVYDIAEAAMEKAKNMGVNLAKSNEDVFEKCEVVLLAVKPQQSEEALAQVKKAADGKAMLSIVAGKTTQALRDMIDGNVRILRINPNTPAMVFESASGLVSDTDLTEEEKQIAEELFNAIGIVEWVPEKLIDTVCGLSGGGPAYVAMFIEALADGGVKNGLPRATAYHLACQTCLGTAKMLLEKGMHPGELKDMVTSPGGTTIEGVECLERGGMRYAVIDCINEATAKSKKL